MARQKIQDIIIKNKKSPIVQNVKEKLGGRFGRGKFVFGLALFFFLAVLSIKAIDLFAKTIIRVALHQETKSIDVVLRSGEGASFDLPFETMELQITEEKSIKATGVKTIASKASGDILIYNAFSSASQKLVANTRFETPEGKIYRIKKSIIVPGAKIENGQVAPSSIQATIYADQPGEEYNIDLSDFTIPGLEGGPRYEKFYGRSVTSMLGGFEGEVPVISDDDMINLKKSLEDSIGGQLFQRAKQQLPPGFLLYDGAAKIIFSENQAQNNSELGLKNPQFTLKEAGSFSAVLISEKNLSEVLVKKYLGEDLKGKVEVANLKDLNFELINLDTDKKTMVFKLKGEAKFTWLIDEEKLKEALTASPKNMEDVFKAYPAIDHAAVVFSPSWWRFFPDKTSKIKIERVLD
ncbi:hypothetical protein KKB69_00880 [Patescibacteria group bacterium]|nr:hypothetical protein [Patescibacteria group bacterium]